MEEFVFLDDLEMVSPLGRGAYSIVYKVKNRVTNDFYALKIVNKHKATSSRVSKRIENEIALQSSLNHPNIVKLIKSFEDHENFYLLLELCPGGELFSHLKSSGKFSEEETKKLASDIVEGLKYLHSKNILHRDLKLGNILLTADKSAKIADFGLAAQLSDLSEERSTLCGTPNYISPEIIARKPYGLASDLWSLGCIIFACLTGHPPFDSPSIQDTLLKLRDMNLHLPQDLSSEAVELLRDLLNWDPDNRLNVFQVKEHKFFRGKAVPCLSFGGVARADKGCEYSESMESSRFVPSRNYIRSKSRCRDLSANKENYIDYTKFDIINTEGLKPFIHLLNNGKMEITDKGWLIIQIGKKLLEVSPNGENIKFMGAYLDKKSMKRTPSKMLKLGSEFLQVLKSKTPKVTVEESGARCMLMSNSPFPNFEVDFEDGTRVKYQVGSELFSVSTLSGKEFKINPYLDQRSLGHNLEKVLSISMDGLKKCLAKDKSVH